MALNYENMSDADFVSAMRVGLIKGGGVIPQEFYPEIQRRGWTQDQALQAINQQRQQMLSSSEIQNPLSIGGLRSNLSEIGSDPNFWRFAAIAGTGSAIGGASAGEGAGLGAGPIAATNLEGVPVTFSGIGTVPGTGVVGGGTMATGGFNWGNALIAGGNILGGYMAGEAQISAAEAAAQAQGAASRAGIEESRRQFDAMREILSPYVQAGTGAIGAQQALLGLSGPEAQRQAITALQESPQFQTLAQQGENAILQNASATGGLRGGNVQGALAQYRPQLLSQLIEQQYGRLGGLSQLGQASAAGVGSAGITTGQGISNLLQQQGAAEAGAALAAGRATGQQWNALGQGIGMYYGLNQPQANTF